MKKKYTILDIARLSGFSKSTVSKVLRNELTVKDSTRKKIEKIISKTGYRPDEIARYMVTKKNVKFIGLLVSNIENPVYAEIALGVENEARKKGYNVVLCDSKSFEEEKNYINVLLNNRAPGVVLMTASFDDSNVKYLSKINYPYVLINGKVRGIKSNEVSVNHLLAAKDAVKLLIEKGHRKIAHFNSPNKGYGLLRRIEGYKMSLKENNIEYDSDLLFRGDQTIDGGFSCAEKLIESGKKPTAIFTSNDLMAIGAMDYFNKNGYRVPGDFSIIGFDNINISSLEAINLTTVNTPKYKLGSEAIRLLFKRIENGSDFISQNYDFKTEIVIRKSIRELR